MKEVEIGGRTLYKNGSGWSYADPNYIKVANNLRSAGYQPSETLVTNILKINEYAEKQLTISDLKSLGKTPPSPARPDEYLSLIRTVNNELAQQETLLSNQLAIAEA